MPEKINWSLNVQVVGGPKVSMAQTTEVEAYDKIEVKVPAQGTATVEVQPGATEQVKFLLITAGDYEAGVTYTVTGGAEAGVVLDAPHLLVKGGVALLGAECRTFEFNNAATDPVTVGILVGRDATPSE